jgi:hypothetical protein
MFRRLNNKILLILFAILAIVMVAIYLYDRKTGDRTFRSDLFAVDTASVTAVKIFPKGKTTDPVILEKSGKKWLIKSGGKSYPADSSAISSMLSSIANVTAERVAASDKEGWKGLEITDSLGRHVVVEQGGNVAADFVVGKISFSQSQNQQYRGGNQGFSVKSHIRVAGDDRVYVVDGFLSMLFSDQPGQYRNKVICRFDQKLATRLTFVYPGDSSFVLEQSMNGWMINGKPADSAKTANYLNAISSTSGNEFADEGTLPVTYPYSLKIEGNNMPPIEITGAIDPVKKMYYIRSNANTQAVFGSANTSLFGRIFASKSTF